MRDKEEAGCKDTVAALNRPKNNAKEKSEAAADEELAITAKHGPAYEEEISYLADARRRNLAGVAHEINETEDKEQGRLETRRYWNNEQNGRIAERAQREKKRSVAQRGVGGERTGRGGRATGGAAGVSEQTAGRRPLAGAGGAWPVGDREPTALGDVRVQMGEDASHVRTGHAAEKLATLRKIVLNLLRRDTQSKVGIRAKQLKASWDHAYLHAVLKL